MIIGTLCAIAHGASMPVMALIFGNMSDAFINNDKMTNYINEVMPNITAVNANVTKASILEDPNKFMYVASIVKPCKSQYICNNIA